jgi:SAM-dependent methyltransferase
VVAPRLKPVVARGRAALDRLAVSSPRARSVLDKVARELTAVVDRAHARVDFYGPGYFGEGRDPTGDRAGCSGYARYDRVSSNADVAATVLWRTFGGAGTVLDVGCATGFVVEALRELGLDAVGCDVSRYAVDHAAPGARGHVQVGDLLAGLPWPDASFDLVSVLETLEHLPPEQVPAALAELRRVCAGFVYATIPSFGANNGAGPDGFFEGKVLPERLEHYRSLDTVFAGPVPFVDLARDSAGRPIEGHLTMASFGWWTECFAAAGFERRPDVERRIYADLEPAGLATSWNVYVMAVPGPSPALATPRRPDRTLVELGLRHPLYGT